MSVHLYCVLPDASRSAVPEGLHGLAGHGVRALPLESSSLVAWVSEVERSLPVSIDGVREHDAVIDAALGTGGTPVPARYGQRFASDDDCRAALALQAASVTTLVDKLQGMVEMTLLFAPTSRRALRDLRPEASRPEHPNSDAGMGRRYLATLRDRDERRRAIAALASELATEVTAAIGALVKRSLEHTAVAELPLLTVSHLIHREAADDYRARAERVVTGDDIRLLVIGPRAPYSFCALAGGSSGTHGMKLAD
jgi:hypothetical protein